MLKESELSPSTAPDHFPVAGDDPVKVPPEYSLRGRVVLDPVQAGEPIPMHSPSPAVVPHAVEFFVDPGQQTAVSPDLCGRVLLVSGEFGEIISFDQGFARLVIL